MTLLFGLLTVMAADAAASPVRHNGSYARPDLLVETSELATKSNQLRIIDVRSASAYQAGHIGKAVHFDVARLRTRDPRTGYLPTASELARMAGEIGIRNDTRVVIYDEGPSARAARLWYVLDHHGHRRVSLLNGGWNKWRKEGRPVVIEPPPAARASFTARVEKASLSRAPDLEQKLGRKDVLILDVRSADEYRGEAGRARTRGHVPGAVHVEWKENLSDDGTFKAADQLRAIYAKAGVTPEKEVVTYCQTGGRASHSLFVLRLIGHEKTSNYYGSWEEWGNRDGSEAGAKSVPVTGK